MLLMDSVTRVATAQREVGLAIGEPPTTRGYTPSTFAMLPKLLERAGMSESGSITGLYTVLVEGDDLDEPIADAVRAILDGHVVLSRRLASQGHYPAIDVLESVSRVMTDVVEPDHLAEANAVKEALVTFREAEDLINVGAYQRGNSAQIDFAIDHMEEITGFLRQDLSESSEFSDTRERLSALLR